MGGILVAARARVDCRSARLSSAVKAAQYLIIEADELPARSAREGIELHRQAAFGEVDLHFVGAFRQAITNIGLGFADKVIEELLSREYPFNSLLEGKADLMLRAEMTACFKGVRVYCFAVSR